MDVRQAVASSSSAAVTSLDGTASKSQDGKGLVDSLMQFISKNKTFPALFDACDAGKYANQLKTIKFMIENPGVKTPEVTSFLTHEFRMEMIVYLMKKEQIDYWDGIAFYAYLMAIYEFGSDSVTLRQLVDHNRQLTPFALTYLEDIKNHFEVEISQDIDTVMAELTNYLIAASPINQCCINVNFSTESRWDSSKERFMNIIKINLPLMAYNASKYSNNIFYDPPRNYYINLGMIRHVCSLMSDKPMRMLPVFGSVSKKTLAELHRQHCHPAALSALWVKSNMENVHDFKTGFFLTFVHDILHVFMANLLSADERNSIFKCIDDLNALKMKCGSDSIVQAIETLVDELNDFDLSPIFTSAKMSFRLNKYLFDCLKRAKILHNDRASTITCARVLEIVSDRVNFAIGIPDDANLICEAAHKARLEG